MSDFRQAVYFGSELIYNYGRACARRSCDQSPAVIWRDIEAVTIIGIFQAGKKYFKTAKLCFFPIGRTV